MPFPRHPAPRLLTVWAAVRYALVPLPRPWNLRSVRQRFELMQLPTRNECGALKWYCGPIFYSACATEHIVAAFEWTRLDFLISQESPDEAPTRAQERRVAYFQLHVVVDVLEIAAEDLRHETANCKHRGWRSAAAGAGRLATCRQRSSSQPAASGIQERDISRAPIVMLFKSCCHAEAAGEEHQGR
jgi:hypothetical protein